MELFLAVLLFLVLIGLSHIVHRFLPFVPIPLIQIASGVVAALLPLGIHLPLEPELFFLLFIAPLLYNDGRRTPREELWNLRAPILALALGLVFATVLVAGYFIHWMVPTISLPAAFALAAILSPTDAVAVSSMTGRVQLPRRIVHLLEGEALMNDASGLVAFRFAIAAAVTGVFSLREATLSFLLISIGGLLCGALGAFLIIRLSVYIRRLGMEDVTVQMLLQILTPFLLFLASEELGLSGILAVVAGGVVHAIERDRATSPQYKLQLVSASTWSVILFLLNGLVFVILGVQMPAVLGVIIEDPTFNNWQVFGLVLLITTLLICLRFIWVFLFSNGVYFLRKQKSEEQPPSLKANLLIALSGVRGAVTLAGAFSIPLTLVDGSPFPQRDLMIFLAAGVILASLISASALLPLFTVKQTKTDKQPTIWSEETAQEQLMLAGERLLKQEMTPENQSLILSILAGMTESRRRLHELMCQDGSALQYQREKRAWKRVAIGAERHKLAELIEQHRVSPAVAHKMNELLDRTEYLLAEKFDEQFIVSMKELGRHVAHFFTIGEEIAAVHARKELDESKCAKIEMAHAAIATLQAQMTPQNRHVVGAVITHYELLISRLGGEVDADVGGEVADEQKLELQLRAFQEQRNTVQTLFEQGNITREMAGRLRRFVNELEASILEGK